MPTQLPVLIYLFVVAVVAHIMPLDSLIAVLLAVWGIWRVRKRFHVDSTSIDGTHQHVLVYDQSDRPDPVRTPCP